VRLPAILLGLFVCTACGLAQGTTIWSITLTNVVGATCLQFGYLGGALLKLLIFAGRFDGTKSSQSARPFAHQASHKLSNCMSLHSNAAFATDRAQVSVLFPLHLL
jgi:hypothetical protein